MPTWAHPLPLPGLLLAPVACVSRPDTPPSSSGDATPDSATSTPAIFREIDIRPFGKVALGAPFTEHSVNTVVVAPGSFLLDAGGSRFANTDSILVRVDAENRVRAIYFVYRSGTDFARGVGDYRDSLGEPVSRGVVDSAGGQLERAVWEDPRTRFELTRFVVPGRAPRIASAMFDRTTFR